MIQTMVVDSSVILKWLYHENENYVDKADLLLKRASENKIVLMAPELAKYEVGNVLLVAKKLPELEGQEALKVFHSLPINFFPESDKLAKQTYSIGLITGTTYYDASFMALAKQEKAILVTDNPKHQAQISGVNVLPLKDY